jgi:hypothetical protein
MTDDVRAVEFVAEVRQVKTMADGTVNLTLNLPEYCKPQAAWFMQHQGEMVKSVSELEVLKNKENGTTKRADKQSRWQTTEGAGVSGETIGGIE